MGGGQRRLIAIDGRAWCIAYSVEASSVLLTDELGCSHSVKLKLDPPTEGGHGYLIAFQTRRRLFVRKAYPNNTCSGSAQVLWLWLWLSRLW